MTEAAGACWVQGIPFPSWISLPSFVQAAAMHFYELEKSQGSPVSIPCCPCGSLYRIEEEGGHRGKGIVGCPYTKWCKFPSSRGSPKGTAWIGKLGNAWKCASPPSTLLNRVVTTFQLFKALRFLPALSNAPCLLQGKDSKMCGNSANRIGWMQGIQSSVSWRTQRVENWVPRSCSGSFLHHGCCSQ